MHKGNMKPKWPVVMIVAVALALTGTASFVFYDATNDRVAELMRKYDLKALPQIESEPSNGDNIILVLTDDQNHRTWQYMPYLRGIANDRGVVFSNAFVTNPECCPFRASLISGGFDTHETGVKSNSPLNGTLNNLDENRTVATYLQSAGIKTGFVGKYLHGYLSGYVPPGWDSFVANALGSNRDYWNLNDNLWQKWCVCQQG